MSDRPATDEQRTYASAGVDLDAAQESVRRITPALAGTRGPHVLDGGGGFAGLFALPPHWREPVLVSSTDGVGTKLELARRLGRLEGVGQDLVAMVVDDLVVAGAQPLFLLDYLAVGHLRPEVVQTVVTSVARACAAVDCALLGGETAEHPGVMEPDALDLAGFAVGVVERDAVLGADRVREGDAVVAMASNGAHSNGYSLVRQVVEGVDLDVAHGLAEPLGEALLRPTALYTPVCRALLDDIDVHAFAHVTGGGVVENLRRVLPDGLGATVDAASFPVPPVLRLLQRLGPVPADDMWRTFNMGAGMLAVVTDTEATLTLLAERGVRAWQCGRVESGAGVRLLHAR